LKVYPCTNFVDSLTDRLLLMILYVSHKHVCNGTADWLEAARM